MSIAGVKRGPYRDTMKAGGDGRRKVHGPECRLPGCHRRESSSYAPYCVRHARELGYAKTRVDRDKAMAKVIDLMFGGETMAHIADRATVGKTCVIRLVNVEYAKVAKSTEDLLLGLGDPVTCSRGRVPAWPYRRRVQSLRAGGMLLREIVGECGITKHSVIKLCDGEDVMLRADTAAAVSRMWDRHEFDPVRCPRRDVMERRWMVPLGWENIDDPLEKHGSQRAAPLIEWDQDVRDFVAVRGSRTATCVTSITEPQLYNIDSVH